MAILLNDPTVVPPVDEKVYNEIWMSSFRVCADDPNKPVSVSARLCKARTLADGSKELLDEDPLVVSIDDFFGTAAADELQVMGGLLLAIKARANL